ncbi:unnamed protein product [Fraxinus pennsylvanica]|uniref:Uncharacterized protein n=1 Tax=Fraxinus pennsylvanica TaxID=56036 RepID=A0AAD2DL91_9LAMI|nr:unnamed protein product [Fraxinus pennsylvanica]
MQNHSPFFPQNLFSGFSSSFSANKVPETGFVNVILPYAEVTWNQDDVIGNEVKLASESFDLRERREKGQSNGYLIKGQWTEEENGKLTKLVMQYGSKSWAVIAEKMVERAGQCRERWLHHLRPDIKV